LGDELDAMFVFPNHGIAPVGFLVPGDTPDLLSGLCIQRHQKRLFLVVDLEKKSTIEVTR
jgi:hypothetical protein